MQVTVTSADGGQVAQITAEPAQQFSSVGPQLQQQFGIPAAAQVLMLNGNPLRLDQTFEQAGVKEDDLLVIMRNPSAAPAAARPAIPTSAGFTARPGMKLHDITSNPTPETLLDIMDKNPQLLAELQQVNPKLATALQTKSVSVRGAMGYCYQKLADEIMHMEAASRKFEEQQEIEALERNPFDAEAQAKIAERIRLSNIAIEEMPEAFGRVTMLYIPCEVNGTQVKAFVDSGAQSTIMSSSCAERCGIMRLVDKRFAGQAVGVGTATIIGKVHMAPLKIGNEFYNCSFTILDQQGVDFLFGLDMLKRHQCCIDLSKNVLRLHEGDSFHEVSFLPEHEIPSSENRADSARPPATLGGVPVPASTPAAAGSQIDREKVAQLVDWAFLSSGRRRVPEDLYEILGLEPAADERQVARAYKKKSILHHPDRGGDELLRKEQIFERNRKPSAKQQKAELSKLREKALARQQELQDRLARESKRRAELKNRELRSYGEIETIKMKTSSAKVVFTEASAAASAVRIEGHKDCWREVSIQGHIVETDGFTSTEDKTTTKTTSKRNVVTLTGGPISLKEHLAFEEKVLAALREKAKSQQEQQQQLQ
ncbi:Ubiquitin-related domain [Phytophthora cactorum]|nr:Ubiquitin-related domain [Phytophthora cactorum]